MRYRFRLFLLSFQGITTPMRVATYDNIGTKDIIDQMPTQEQINRQIDLAEVNLGKEISNERYAEVFGIVWILNCILNSSRPVTSRKR